MSIVKDVLLEEYERLKNLKEKYMEEIQKFPEGTITKKKRNNNFYLYLTYRNKKKVISVYVARWNSEKANFVIKQIEQRKIIEKKLKEVNKNLRELRRVINGKKI
jgi:hypothetical protein